MPTHESLHKNTTTYPISPAAVLVPLLKQNQEWHLLFIRRAHVKNDVHSGQVAFPGGRFEPGEQSIEETALRETQEEIGIPPKDIRVLGHLNPIKTVTGFIIFPVVGLIPWPFTIIPSPQEVSRVFTIPIEWLSQKDNYQIKFLHHQKVKKAFPVIYFKPYDGEILWGASARIALEFLKVLRII